MLLPQDGSLTTVAVKEISSPSKSLIGLCVNESSLRVSVAPPTRSAAIRSSAELSRALRKIMVSAKTKAQMSGERNPARAAPTQIATPSRKRWLFKGERVMKSPQKLPCPYPKLFSNLRWWERVHLISDKPKFDPP